MQELKRQGWKLEQPLDIAILRRPGKLDAVLYTDFGPVALEWETGNISSSHRALNKMALGLLEGVLAGGNLVVPSRALYKYLTDRLPDSKRLG
jgi:restriction endonuclease BamHI